MKKIQILGTGCPKCAKLAEHAQLAIHRLGLPAEIEKVTDINAIAAMGVMMTPGLAIDGEVKSAGKLLSVEQIVELLSQ